MEATRILPDLQCSLLCEDIRQEATGNFILVGILNHIRVPQLPVTALKICVFNRWTAGVGSFVERVRLIAPDGQTQLRESKVKFKLDDPNNSATNASVFGQLQFQAAGPYHIEIEVDDVMKLRYALPVIEVPQAEGESEQPPPSVKEN
ncbi:MAG: hypothetical protein CMO74_09430 [Verrucomicrobiales bacterium]|nr:hypothetical protein [Verrucomicrobiales bacterium]|tara:strand:+ start:334 stop:777 length:444 start_codon:yes stop_codon:yes gene_type:complete